MGSRKGFHIFFVLWLSLGVFCGEVPEFYNLNDDVSNDLIWDSSASLTGKIEVTGRDSNPELRISLPEEPVRNLPAILFIDPAPPSSRQLLRLFSNQRT